MQKVVVDTNVLVSALIQQNYPYLIIHHFLDQQKFQWCISEELFREYYEVLNRRKFSRYPEFVNKAESLLAIIEAKAVLFVPGKRLNVINDIDDNRLLELAVACRQAF